MAKHSSSSKRKHRNNGKPLQPAPENAGQTIDLPPSPAKKIARDPWWRRQLVSARFGRLYATVSAVILGFTTLLWSILGARLQLSNADQLVDPYLFADKTALHGASFPAAHSFLIKWPLFWLISLAHFSSGAYIAVTVLCCLLTVGALAALLYKIERRPAVFGSLCLALASMLLLVPAQPYAGGLLPVNMAMLTTRNIEYLLYIGGLAALIRSPRVKSWQCIAATALLGVLFASDSLFIGISLGAALLLLFVFALRQHTDLIVLAARWVLATLVAIIGSAVLKALIGFSQLTGFSSHGASPYAVSSQLHDLALGSLYAIGGILTNFGANPAYDELTLRRWPHAALSRLLQPVGFAYIINAALLLALLYVAGRLLYGQLRRHPEAAFIADDATKLGAGLLTSAVVAIGLFVGTQHYYPVDARYLTISLFAVFIAAAAWLRRLSWRRTPVIVAGLVVFVSICIAVPANITTYSDQSDALQTMQQHNNLILQALAKHPVASLAGDYWRTIPIRQSAGNKLAVVPLANCTQPRDTLVSTQWLHDWQRRSFAYLLTLQKGLTDFPSCNLQQITQAFGSPNASLLIAGTFVHPDEELLFYDRGVHSSKTGLSGPHTLTSLTPVAPRNLPNIACTGPTILNVVAHQDDDLLFTSPDLLHDIDDGHCVRTVYVTAGDAGSDQFYWLSRQQGSQAAYDNMLHDTHGWMQHIIRLSSSAYATVSSPHDNNKVMLVFLNLPDGAPNGQGFKASHYQSLAKLESGRIATIHGVDKQSTYTSAELRSALLALMQAFQPTEVRTLATQNESPAFPDHSDHLAVGRFTQAAYEEYVAALPADNRPSIQHYIGYPVHDRDPNVADDDLSRKAAAFFAYAGFDGSTCRTIEQCSHTVYDIYLYRQYVETQPAPVE